MKAERNNIPDSCEYALPTAFDALIRNGSAEVTVIPTNERWYGMTYIDDRAVVKTAIAEMTSDKQYCSPLFE